MKPSPLRLKWVTYPKASYEIQEEFEGDPDEPVSLKVTASVRFHLDKSSMVQVFLETPEEPVPPYKVSVVAVGAFDVDLDRAREAYKSKTAGELSTMVAANICRILFGGAREQISMMTARAPYGAMAIESVLIEPADVEISSPDDEPLAVLQKLFGASEEEVEQIRARVDKLKSSTEPPVGA